MKTNFTNSLIRYLIEKDYFNLINSDNEPLDFRNGTISLIKSFQGTSVLLEVIDADRYSVEQLTKTMENGAAMLGNINGKNASIFKLLLFNETPNEEKIRIIEQGQTDIISEKKFMKCMSIDIMNKNVHKHFSVPSFDANIVKLVKRFFSKNLDTRETSTEGISELIAQRKKDFEIQLKAKKPWLTYGLIAINIAVFLILKLMSIKTVTPYDNLLAQYGAKINNLILDGEYWRFISATFLHSNEIHLLVNCYSLFIVGSQVERLFGHGKFIAIYFISGLLGSIASFAFSINASVGASGAIFGLLGAMLFFAMKRPSLLKSSFGANLVTTLIINLVYGFMNTQIDNYAHIGGLIGGFLITGVVYTVKEETSKDKLSKLIALILVIAVTIGGLFYSFNNEQNQLISKIVTMQNYEIQKNYTEAEKLAEEILTRNPQDTSIRSLALLSLSFSEVILKKYDESEQHAEEVLKINLLNEDTKIEILSNLTLAEISQGKYAEGEEHAEEVLRMNPKDKDIKIKVLSNLTLAETSQQKYSEAEEHAEEILKINPNSKDIITEVLWNISLAEASQLKFEEAKEHAKQLLDLSPVHGHFILGAIYYNTKEFDKAKEELQAAKKLDSPNLTAIDNMLTDIENILKSK